MRFWITDARAEVFDGAENRLFNTGTVDRLSLRHIGQGGEISPQEGSATEVYLFVCDLGGEIHI